MEFTRKTIIKTGPDVYDHLEYENARVDVLKPFVYYKKTDGIPILVDPDTIVRYWVDQESAGQYRDRMMEIAAKYNQDVQVFVELI